MNYPKISYKLNNKEKDFNYIKDYLFKVDNDYDNQISIIYEKEKYSRLLYGKLFRKVKEHQDGSCKISEIIRYILNRTSIENKIQDSYNLHKTTLREDYEDQYNKYTKNIFDAISSYLSDLFKINKLTLKTHYENMLIKSEFSDKGISIKKCKEISMEEYILYLFMKKLNKLPIAQNILICSNKASIEEIQSFLYRAILCEYNTLFVVEILDSFSNFQHNKMYSYIDKIISIKFNNYKTENEGNKNIDKIDKSKSRDYLDSYIVFVYKNLENENAFRNELEKYTKDNNMNKEKEWNLDNINGTLISNNDNFQDDDLSKSRIIIPSDFDITKNIKVITSDVCGLGKSFKIKKEIKEKDKRKYFHFPLGGKLTKSDIYKKISDLFNKIEKDSYKTNKKSKDIIDNSQNGDEDYSEFNNVAIHLDLIDTKETSLINEFLFSFLITRFYTNNGNIIYIPNNLKIYIEVPNSFETYLTKFGILKSFNIENIIMGESKQKETDVSMLPLELEKNIREQFERLNGFKNDKDIENFIRKSLKSSGLEEFSYHQIQTFIKLYLSQFESFTGKLRFTNSLCEDVTNKYIEYFCKSTKYFTNGGFQKLIMQKKYIKDKYELCLDAYENDLNEENFDNPLMFWNEENKKLIVERLPDKEEVLNKDVDIVYMIDATGGTGFEIKAARDYVFKIFKELKEMYKDNDFQFGAIFYRDKVFTKTYRVPDEDEYECYPLTNDIKKLEKEISNVRPSGGGGDGAEDWAGGYELALNNMNWRNGIKLIIHICDDGAHGEQFTPGDPFFEEGEKLISEIKECVKKNINIIGFKIGKYPENSFKKIEEIYNDYKMNNKDNGQFIEIYNFERRDSYQVSENFKKLVMLAAHQVLNHSYKYLKRLKSILNIPNDLVKDIEDKKSLISMLNEYGDDCLITDDKYKIMILLAYRIKANIPVIIMGDTGCGKTSLIKKLNQILNNGEELLQIIYIHPGITEKEIVNKMRDLNNKAKYEKYQEKELWAFFDEINTCLSFSLLTEIFVNRTFNGEKLEENIRLIGACNPYRKRKESTERYSLTRDDEEDQLVYKVELLPQSLLYYVFSFGPLQGNEEKKYIKIIIHRLFIKEEEKLYDLTTESISQCHIFLRKSFGNDPTVVSLREIERFNACVEFFEDYFTKKGNFINERIDNNDETKKVNKIKSIICSVYICYYIRLTEEKRNDFENNLRKILLKIANVHCEDKKDEKRGDLFYQIRYEKLRYELRDKNFTKFSELLKIEEEFLLDQIELDKGIGKNQSLKENIFLSFLALVTNIPLIIVGKSGTGKSLSVQLLYNSMRGKYSKLKNGKKSFFANYPKIKKTYFQGSESTSPEDIVGLFNRVEEVEESYRNYEYYNKIDKENPVPIYMILFDRLELAEKSPTNPLKVLHSKLEYGGKTEGICFIGISNYNLDINKVKRAFILSVPNLQDSLGQLKSTTKSIVESISDKI